jgi:hypothetical protein
MINLNMKNLFTKNYRVMKVLALLVLVVMGGSVKGQVTILNDNFGGGTFGSGNTSTSLPSGTSWTASGSWVSSSSAYQAGQENSTYNCLKLGGSSSLGTISTINNLNLSGNGGVFSISLDYKGWTTIEGNVLVSVNGGSAQSLTPTQFIGSTTFNSSTLNFSGGTVNSYITISTSAKRAFIANVKVFYNTTPSAPTINSITSGNAQLSVAFTAGANGGSAITNYSYSTDGGSNFTACSPTQTTSPIVITGLTNGTSYNVQIRAINAIGNGTATSNTAATPATIPSAPTINSITSSNAQLSVAFTAGANGGSAITNYKYSTDGGISFRTRASGTTASPIVITTLSSDGTTALSNGTSYDVQIKAVNAIGDGTATTSTAATPSSPQSYTWNVNSGNWATSTSWSPSRTSPNTNDILIFDGNTHATPTVTVDFATSQTIGQLKLQNNANVTLNTDGNRTINIGASISGNDLDIPSGSTLNLQSTAAIAGLTVNVVTGNIGSISGTVNTATSVSADQTHQLKAADASGITFNSGGSFTAGLQSSDINNPFGSTGTAGSIIFANGSTFTQFAGTNPFALTVPASIVTFNPSSTYVYKRTGNVSPPFDSRTYGNFEFDATANGTISSGSGTIAGNLIITSGTFSLAGTSSFSVGGNITIASGATLNYSPSSPRSITLNGSTLKTISGSGTLTLGSNASISVVNTAGVTFSKNITIGTSGTFTLPASGSGIYTFSAGNIFTHSNATASSCNFNGRSITLKSDATGTAAFGTFASTALNATNITVERYIPATRRAYRFLAAPVTTTGGVYASWQESGTNAAGLGIQVTGFASATPGVDATSGLDKSLTGSSSMFTYNGSAWVAVDNTNTTQLTPGAGFRVLVRGDRMTDLYAAITPVATATTIKATGAIGQGTVTLNALVTGFNLLGNPYPSSIDWNATGWGTARNATNVYDAIYIYDPAVVASNTSMTYPTYLNGVGTNGGSNIIRSGQAFFVEAAASASISFLEAYKSTTVTGGFFRSALPEMMRVTYMQNNEHLDDIVIRYNDDAQSGFDSRFDARSMGGDANGLASFKNADRLAIHTRPTAVGDDSVALSVRNTTTGNYQLKFSEMEGFAASTNITLLDKFLNVQYDVKQDSIVNFEITTDVNSKGDDRFWLFYNNKSTGINQQALVKNKINVYPNPASSVINLSLKLAANQKSTYTYHIYNQLGAMVQAGEVDFADNKQAQINIDAFSAGVYFISASNGKDLQTIKFVK